MHERILLISENYPPRTGGSGRWFYEIYPRLGTKQAAVLTTADISELPAPTPHAEVAEHRVPWFFSSWGLSTPSSLVQYARLIRATVKRAREMKAEAIHCGRNLPEGFVGLVAARLLRIPLVVFVHGEDVMTATASRQLHIMTRWVLNGATRLVANSENTASILRNDWQLPDEAVHVLHPGADCKKFEPTAERSAVRDQLGWNERTVLLTVGRLQKRKGHDIVIQTLPRLKESTPNILFSIVGSGEEEPTLRALAKEAGVEDHVEFRGETTDQELRECYQGCDLFVLANRTIGTDIEGFGMVLVEAQASGRPVLAGDSGGTRETMDLGVTGQIVNAAETGPLGDAIEALLSDPEKLNEMGAKGREFVTSRFDWNVLESSARTTLLSL